MIARLWRGPVEAQKADTYLEYMKKTGVSALRATPGNRGVFVLRRVQDGRAEFVFVSLWDSMEAVRRFTGPEAEKAVYYPEDDAYLLEKEPGVTHYDVVVQPAG